jgi:hypothetical protein
MSQKLFICITFEKAYEIPRQIGKDGEEEEERTG